MSFKKLFILLGLISGTARASEVSYTRSQSSSSYSDRLKATYSFESGNKLGLSYKQSKDTSGASDDKSSTLKGSFKYKLESGTSFTAGISVVDDSYFYEGQSVSLKASIPVLETEFSKDSKLKTKLNLGFEFGDRRYSKITGESFSQRIFSAGVDQDLPYGFSTGVDFSSSNYLATGPQTTKALNGQTVTTTDISNYASSLGSTSGSVYLEFSSSDYTVGVSGSVDNDYIGGGKSTSTELYGEIVMLQDFSLSLSYSKGRTQGSTTTTDTSSVGLGYSF